MTCKSRIPSSFTATFVFGAAMFGCAPTPPSVPAAVTSVATEPPPDRAAPAPIERAKPDIVRVGAGEAVVVAPGQIVEGKWFRVAVFGDKACGSSLGGGTLHAIDFFYDNLTPELTRFFSKSATIELVNARGESFAVTAVEAVDGDGHGYSVYPTTNTSCELGRFPSQIDPRASGKGSAAFALVPAGTRGLSVRVEVRPVGKSAYDGYRPVTVGVPLGDVGR